mgnify:CR=1 FL=1
MRIKENIKIKRNVEKLEMENMKNKKYLEKMEKENMKNKRKIEKIEKKKIEDQPIEINIIFFRIIFVNNIVRRTKKCLILQLKFIDPNLFSDINSVSLKIGLECY